MFNRRKKYFVKQKLQFKYLAFVFLAMLIPTVICCGALYYLIWQTIAAEIAIPEALEEHVIPALREVNIILLVIIPLIFFIMLLIAFYISHKIAGPVYRVEKELEEIIKGDYSRRIKLRANDELKELAEGINQLLDHFEKNIK